MYIKDACTGYNARVNSNGSLQVTLDHDNEVPFTLVQDRDRYHITINTLSKDLVCTLISVLLLKDDSLSLEQSLDLMKKKIDIGQE